MRRVDLISRGFKFEIVAHRKPAGKSFTTKELVLSVEKALTQLPEDLQVIEVAIDTHVLDVPVKEKYEVEMQTFIYWKEKQ